MDLNLESPDSGAIIDVDTGWKLVRAVLGWKPGKLARAVFVDHPSGVYADGFRCTFNYALEISEDESCARLIIEQSELDEVYMSFVRYCELKSLDHENVSLAYVRAFVPAALKQYKKMDLQMIWADQPAPQLTVHLR
ncbi:MAG: hypothetical protein ACR2PA_02130 [Hyphomicrobiaceae bacterium]